MAMDRRGEAMTGRRKLVYAGGEGATVPPPGAVAAGLSAQSTRG